MSLRFVLRKLTTMAEDQPPPSSDTNIAKLVLNKLGETLEEFHSRALPVLSLSEQLDDLQSSLAMPIAEVMEGRVCEKCREMMGRERELDLREEKLNEDRRKLVSREKRVEEEFMACCKELNLKKEELVECRRMQGKKLEFELEELSKKWEDLEAKEKKIKEGFERLKSKELNLRRRDRNGCVSKKNGVLVEQCKTIVVGRGEMSDLELEEKEMSVCLKLLEMREAKINEMIETGSEETRGSCRAREDDERTINEDRKRIKLTDKEMNDNLGAIEFKVKKLEEYCEELERKHCEAMELREKQLNEGFDAIDAKAKHVNERIREMGLKESEINVRSQQLETKDKVVTKFMKVLKMRGDKLKERCQAMELREKELNQGFDAIDAKAKEVDKRIKEMEVKESENNVRCQDVGVKQKNVNMLMRALQMREEKLKERCQAMASKEKEIDEKSDKIELKLQQHEERYQGLKLQEKQVRSLYEAKVAVEKALRDNLKAMDSKASEGADQVLILCKGMSGRRLQMLLNERFMEHQSMMEKLCNGLKLSNDPAQLVLSAIYRFYPPHLERPGSSGFDTRAVRSSCMLLLEYLMNMNAYVGEAVKNEAIRVANQWKHGMVAEGITSIVVLGFLLLLAAYNLGSNYELGELQGYYEMIYQHRLASDIGFRLGLSKPKNGEDKRYKVDPFNASQMFMPYNPTGALYGPPANSVPFEFQYPVWQHQATPATCNHIPPFWCCWCHPEPYSDTYMSQ